jgi:predicted  nucleic acid-binding Zn-ribbon protein
MEKLTAKKRLTIVRQYLSGLSYDEIAAKSGVSKGTVANVVTELKAGNFAEAADVGEHIEVLRDLSLDLRRLNLSPGQCAAGLILLNRINECGLDPADIDRWPMILKLLKNEDDAREFVRAVYSIQDVQKRTGMDLEALDNKVRELERKAADLEPLSNKIKECQKELAELAKHREELESAIALLEQKNELLTPRVKELEEREQTLSHQIADMEPRAQKAEMTISTLKSEMQKLKDIGLSLKELAEFRKKLEVVTQRHTIKPTELKSRLLHELENLDKGLGLETLIESRQQDLDKAEKALVMIKNETEATRVVFDSLKREKTGLETSIKETREKVSHEIAKIVPLAQDMVSKLGEELRRGNEEALAEMRRLRDEAVDVGKEIGQFEGILQSSKWLDELLALVRGEEEIEANRVRVIALLLVRSVATWLKRHDSHSLSSMSLLHTTERLISELETWKT